MWDSKTTRGPLQKVCAKKVYLVTLVLPPSFSHPTSQHLGLSGVLAAVFSEGVNDAASQESHRQSTQPPTETFQ